MSIIKKIFIILLGMYISFQAIDSSHISYKKIQKISYVSIDKILKIDSHIKYYWQPLLLIGELKYNQRFIRFQVDQNFIISNGLNIAIEHRVIYRNNTIYFSLETVEEILSELKIPVRYRFTKKKLKYIRQKKNSKYKKKSFHKKYTNHITKHRKHLDFIVLDAGHGGKDPGAIGYRGIREKDIVLKTVRYLYYQLKKTFPYTKIYLTRFSDRFIKLERRAAIANRKFRRSKNKNGIFLSFHCNSSLSRSSNGFEIYYLAQHPGSASSRRVMLRENRLTDRRKYVRILKSYLMNAQIQSESKRLARSFNRHFGRNFNKIISGRGVRKADFAVLRGSLMPALLIEVGYISNRREALFLQTHRFRKKISIAVINGIKQFIKKLN